MKIKIKLSGNEIRAVVLILQTIDHIGSRKGFASLAQMELLEDLYIRLVVRMKKFKNENNTLSLTFAEAWAMSMQVEHKCDMFPVFEWNTWGKIEAEINRALVNEGQ